MLSYKQASRLSNSRATSLIKHLGGYSPQPAVLSFYITFYCNYRCIMCLAKNPIEEVGGNTDLDPIFKSLEKTRFLFKPRIKITGGEPMLHPRFGEFISYLKGRGHCISINSNGFLLNKYDELLVEEKQDYLNITMLGTDGVYEDVSQVDNSRQKVVDNLRRLTEIKQERGSKYPNVLVNVPINRLNQAHLVDTVKSLQDLPIQRITIQNMGFFKDIHETVGFDRPDAMDESNTAASIDLDILREEFREIKGMESKVPVQFFPDIPDQHLDGYYRDTSYEFPQNTCIQPWMMMSIGPDLTVNPCLYLGTKVGKIDPEGSDLMKVWKNQASAEFRRLFRTEGTQLTGCERCCLRKY